MRETMREYLQTRSDKSILSNSMCNLASIILKNNYFENKKLKHDQSFAIGSKFTPRYSHLFKAGLEKIIFQNSEFKHSCGYDSLMWFLYMDPRFLKIKRAF